MSRRPDCLVLAMDVGSSSARCALLDERGRFFGETHAKRAYAIRYTADRGAELSPAILRRAVTACLGETLRKRRNSALLRRVPIRAVSGCAFWHGLLGVDRAGAPTTPVFTWADSRSAADAAALREELAEPQIHQRTGSMLRATFWPAKLRWLRRTERRVFNATHRCVSPAEWLTSEIFGCVTTSHSMASGTGLYDLRTRGWDPELCEWSGIDARQLGAISDDAERIEVRVAPELRAAVVFPMIGDGAASNLGSGADRESRVATNVGTSAAVRLIEPAKNLRREIPSGLFRYVLDAERNVIGGAISNAGNLRRWCLRELRLSDAEAERALRRSSTASDSLDVLPFWVTERAPTWPEIGGAIAGLSQSASAGDIFRAATASTFYRLADILDRLAEYTRIGEVVVSGGVVQSPATLKLLADALGRDLRVSSEAEASLRGAAFYALRKLDVASSPVRLGRTVRHDRSAAEAHARRRERQRKLEVLLTRSSQ